MQNEINNDEIIIDFNKIFKIINHRKLLIAKTFMICIFVFLTITFILPKKYATSADLYINKTNETNLAELNPYVISSLSNLGGMASMLGGGGNILQNEIDIMQSPLVMDNVIKENNLKYTEGKKKGEFISTADFLHKNIEIENKKGSSIISISYKSTNPILSYNIINSIINNYEKINEEINTAKAIKDKAFLENAYEETTKNLNQKLLTMKHSGAVPETAMAGLGMLTALKRYSRVIGSSMGTIQSQMVEGQKSKISLDQELGKLSLVKTKLEWTKLVEQMSKDTSNVIVLKQPEVKRDFENSEPNIFTNLILGIFFSIFASIIAVIFVEITDKSLTYSALSDNVIYDIEKNLDDLKVFLLANSKENLSLITFEGFQIETLKNLEGFHNLKFIKADITQKVIDEIAHSDKLILAGKIGQTPKKIYQQLKNICTEIKVPVCMEVI